MNQKDNRRVRMTKKALEESLLELLLEEDIHKISIRTLCQRADVNRSTFYKYYSSQYELLKEMENKLLLQIEAALSVNDTTMTDHEKLLNFFVYAQNNCNLFRLLLNANIDPDFPKQLLTLPSVFRRLQEEVQADDPQELRYKQEFIFYGGYQVLKKWINSDPRETPEKMVEIFGKTIPKYLV